MSNLAEIPFASPAICPQLFNLSSTEPNYSDAVSEGTPPPSGPLHSAAFCFYIPKDILYPLVGEADMGLAFYS